MPEQIRSLKIMLLVYHFTIFKCQNPESKNTFMVKGTWKMQALVSWEITMDSSMLVFLGSLREKGLQLGVFRILNFLFKTYYALR